MTVTIINGGTQGLGEAVARRLVEQGGATGLVRHLRGELVAP